MHRFRVWSPESKNVQVVVDGHSYDMQARDGGLWSATVQSAAAGSDYAFLLDDDSTPLPDPRSPWQPQGVHGPSRLVDHRTFAWTDRHFQAKPLKAGLVYELHIGTFTPEGTFESAIQKLDALVDLGVTHVELMPVNQFSGKWGWGYDGVDLYAPHNEYGGPEGLKKLVDACHAKGLAVILDVVYNHLGPEGNYLSRFAPYFSDHYKTPWGPAVNLDGEYSHHVRRFFIDNALMWLRDYHFDGLRIDAIHALIDNGACHFLEQLAAETSALEAHLGRNFVLIAESDLNDPRVVLSRDLGGYGIDAQWSDDFHHALHSVITGERSGYYEDFGGLDRLATAIEQVFVYDGRYSAFRKRPHGRPVDGIPTHRFLGYIQNHDQIGNRAAGDRLSHLVNLRRAKIAAGLVVLSPFVPMLFQGEEWAATSPFQYFTQHEDQALARAVSEGRRHEFVVFGWDPKSVPDPQHPDTFRNSKLNWEEREQMPHAEMLEWHRRLIALRREYPSLSDSDRKSLRVRYDADQQWLTVTRRSIVIACNFSGGSLCVPAEGEAEVVVASEPGVEITNCGVRLPPETIGILRYI